MRTLTCKILFAVFAIICTLSFASSAFAAETVAKTTPKTRFDGYVQYGHGARIDDGGDNESNFFSGKFRARPFEFGPENLRTNIGLMGGLEYGKGKAGTKSLSNYNWNKKMAAFNAKLWSCRYWDLGMDLGAAWIDTKTKGAKQEDTALVAAANLHVEQRRAVEKVWFPETDIYAQITKPISTSKKSDSGVNLKADEKGSKDLKLTQGIYDLRINTDHTIVPGVSVGVGSVGIADKERFQANLGLQAKWRVKGRDLLTVAISDQCVDNGRKNLTTTVTVGWSWK